MDILGILKLDLTVGALHFIHHISTQGTAIFHRITEVGSDSMRHDALLYRALEQETVGTICAVSYNSAQRRHQRVREILGNILRAEVAHIKAQSLFHEFVSVFAVAFFQ